jgi:hypothetical protein
MPRGRAHVRASSVATRAAARSAVPASLRRGMKVERRSGGAVHVRLNVPLLVRGWETPIAVGATARLGDEG